MTRPPRLVRHGLVRHGSSVALVRRLLVVRGVERERHETRELALVVTDQFGAGAELGDLAVVEHDDVVDGMQRRESVGDDQRRPPDHQARHGCLDLPFGLGVDARRRLVEHQHVGVAHPHAGERQQLSLAGRQTRPGGAELAIDVATGESIEPDRPERVDHRGVGHGTIEQGHVVADRPGEEFDLLGHQRDPTAQLGDRDVGDRHPTEPDHARGRLDQSQDEAGERRLAAAGAPDDADRACRAEREVHVAEHRLVVAVVERDTVELDGQRPGRRRDGPVVEDLAFEIASRSSTRTMAPFAFWTVSSSCTRSSSGRPINRTY